VCHYVNAKLSASMAGDLQVDTLEAIELPWVRARGVRIVAPNGVPAIDVGHVEVELDLAAILAGRFAWRRASIHGGVVRVTEDAHGRVNMEETFRATGPEEAGMLSALGSSLTRASAGPDRAAKGPLDLRTMVTSDMVLVIAGGSLPSLRLVDLHGIMRVQELSDGSVSLRFDEYRGSIVKGLPTGRLDFRQVTGHVETRGARLLRFQGTGKSEGEPVDFGLDIVTKPRKRVAIDAHFERPSAEAFTTRAFGFWARNTGTLDLRVDHGRGSGGAR